MLEYITDLFSNVWFFVIFILVNLYLLWHYFIIFINVLTSSASGKTKYVLITGCDSGFGYKAVFDLNASKCTVLAGCLTEEGVERLNDNPAFRGIAFKLDVTKKEDIENAKELVAEQTKEHVEGLHAIVNNAGICCPAPIEWQSTEEMRRVMEVNYWGTVNITKALLPFLKQQKRGRIVNISSMAGRMLFGYGSSYCASKHAVEAFTDGLRYEMKPWGISSHLIEPAMFKTDIFKKLKDNVLKVWNKQSAETKEEYGDNFVNELLMRFDVDQFESPDVHQVILTINHAVLSSNPKPRYLVGTAVEKVGIAIAALPTYISDWIFNMILPAFIPEALKKSEIQSEKKNE